MTAESGRPASELASVKDWLRYAVSRFNAARISYGHGTSNAIDEAAFLILASLDLPIDQLDAWIDCRLTIEERERIFRTIEERITTRKPASYLMRQAWIQGYKFYVDERVIVPRSFIGELICRDSLSSVVANPAAVGTVLDLCTGSGCLAILAAHAFPAAVIKAADISRDALAVAGLNVENYGLRDRIELIEGDLFDALKPETYDLIISNPPYVTAETLKAFPPEHAAEPRIAHDGGRDGLDVVKRILHSAGQFLTPDGSIIVEVGDARERLEAAYPSLPFLWLDTELSDAEVFMLTAADLRVAKTPGRHRALKSNS